MDEAKEVELFTLLGSKGTKKILQYLCEHGKAQYTDLDLDISLPTLNLRLPLLLKFNLIEHHMARETKRREWYEITEKGKKIFEHLREMIELVEE